MAATWVLPAISCISPQTNVFLSYLMGYFVRKHSFHGSMNRKTDLHTLKMNTTICEYCTNILIFFNALLLAFDYTLQNAEAPLTSRYNWCLKFVIAEVFYFFFFENFLKLSPVEYAQQLKSKLWQENKFMHCM